MFWLYIIFIMNNDYIHNIIDSHACAVSIIFKNSFLFLKIIIVGNRCNGIKIEVL